MVTHKKESVGVGRRWEAKRAKASEASVLAGKSRAHGDVSLPPQTEVATPWVSLRPIRRLAER